MSFDEASFPDKIAYGTRGGPKYSTTVHTTAGGREERSARWAYARREWDASYGVKSLEDLSELLTFFMAREGAKRGFRFKDPFDFNTSPTTPFRENSETDTDVTIGTGDGTTTTFQLIKKYTSGGQTRTRTITKPVAGTVLIEVNGVDQTDGVDFTVDTTTGIVTFTTAPTDTHVITAGFEFEVPVRFENDIIETNYDTYSSGGANVPILEIIEDTNVFDDFNWGGHLDVSLTANRSIAVNEARSYSFDPDASGREVTLPDPTNLPAGGPYFYLHNEDGVHSITLKDHNATTLLTIPTTASVTVILAVDAGNNKLWIAF